MNHGMNIIAILLLIVTTLIACADETGELQPGIRCHLDVVGVGAMDENGDALVEYTSRCRIRQVPDMPDQPGRKAS